MNILVTIDKRTKYVYLGFYNRVNELSRDELYCNFFYFDQFYTEVVLQMFVTAWPTITKRQTSTKYFLIIIMIYSKLYIMGDPIKNQIL